MVIKEHKIFSDNGCTFMLIDTPDGNIKITDISNKGKITITPSTANTIIISGTPGKKAEKGENTQEETQWLTPRQLMARMKELYNEEPLMMDTPIAVFKHNKKDGTYDILSVTKAKVLGSDGDEQMCFDVE